MMGKKRIKPIRWHKIPQDELPRTELYLRARERFCVSASARFLRMNENHDHAWYLNSCENKISAFLLHSKRSLFPVFDTDVEVPCPRFLSRFLIKIPIHAIQGLKQDTDRLEVLMKKQGYFAKEQIDYYLMGIDRTPGIEALGAGPLNLILRLPAKGDGEHLFELQAAYEQEEVIPKSGKFNPAACRYNLNRILSNEHILVAELNGEVVGKINTSAESFTRYQVGGVYVRPDYRGLGIGTKMTSVFVQSLLIPGKGITLFVKKCNTTAVAVYRKAGFSIQGDYRICYF